MAKLRRVYEAAAEENRPIEEVAIERYGDLESFEQAKEERKFLDDRGNRRGGHLQGRDRAATQPDKDEFGRDIRDSTREDTPKTTVIYNDPASAASTRSSSRGSSFRKPGEPEGPQGTRTPTAAGPSRSKPSTPIPSVFTPPALTRKPSALSRPPINADTESVAISQGRESLISKPPLSPTSLNRLQAKALKARMMGAEDADSLERTYNDELARAQQGDRGPGGLDEDAVAGGNTEVRVLPTLDAEGRLYDVGQGTSKDEDEQQGGAGPGNRRRRKEKYVETRDLKTGEVLRYNADDDTTSLEELVRQERFRAGKADQKNLDAELAMRITTDAGFQDDLEYAQS
jgi:hypothetical protein